MNTQFDPPVKQADEANEQAPETQASEATQDSEEGTSEG